MNFEYPTHSDGKKAKPSKSRFGCCPLRHSVRVVEPHKNEPTARPVSLGEINQHGVSLRGVPVVQNQWWISYRDAALETDFNRLDDRIEAADRTYFGPDASTDELRELTESWDSLQTLKKYQRASQQLRPESVT